MWHIINEVYEKKKLAHSKLSAQRLSQQAIQQSSQKLDDTEFDISSRTLSDTSASGTGSSDYCDSKQHDSSRPDLLGLGADPQMIRRRLSDLSVEIEIVKRWLGLTFCDIDQNNNKYTFPNFMVIHRSIDSMTLHPPKQINSENIHQMVYEPCPIYFGAIVRSARNILAFEQWVTLFKSFKASSPLLL